MFDLDTRGPTPARKPLRKVIRSLEQRRVSRVNHPKEISTYAQETLSHVVDWTSPVHDPRHSGWSISYAVHKLRLSRLPKVFRC
jgi:hypothetical protein